MAQGGWVGGGRVSICSKQQPRITLSPFDLHLAAKTFSLFFSVTPFKREMDEWI